VYSVLEKREDIVTLVGHVHRDGAFQWQPGMRLTELIPSLDNIRPGADLEYILIRREVPDSLEIEVLSANLSAALSAPGSAADLELRSRDQLRVFSIDSDRREDLRPIIDELQLQASRAQPSRVVSVSGRVRSPGTYPLEKGMRVSDLLRAAGNLSEQAYALYAELTRYAVVNGEYRAMEVVKVNIDDALRGVESADLRLVEHDYLRIDTMPDWDSEWTVAMAGEVRFPGYYRVRRGEKLADVIQRAGGLTNEAFVEGSVFLRESLKEREQEQIETLAKRLESDLASLSLQNAATGGAETLSTGRVLLDQLRKTEAVGRLVIDLRKQGTDVAGSAGGLEMRDGDKLLVPTLPQVVSVLGETQQNTSHLYRADISRDEYIDLSGGLTRRADKKRIYVVRASGAVIVGNGSRWLGRGGKVDIRPGDTIVVPMDTDRMRPLTFWGSVTQILYQGAIAIAAIKTFDN
jgi:protein involved in polysaccharide export with SLBB domain